MRKIVSLVVGFILVMFGLGLLVPAAQATQDEEEPPQVTLCHATSSETNPYRTITVDDDSTKLEGHRSQAPSLGANHPDGDIIPPTTAYPLGQNWTPDGQAIWNNGCRIPKDPEPCPTVTVEVPIPGPTVTVTSKPEPGPTVTVTAPPEPAKTVTATATATATATETATVTVPGPTKTVESTVTATATETEYAVTSSIETTSDELAKTGANLGTMGFAALLIAAGTVLWAFATRRRGAHE